MMDAVLLRLRSEARRRWRAWIALGVAIGIAAGISIAAAAGARRADSAYPRFVRAQRAPHVVLGGIGADDPSDIAEIRARIESFPEVVASETGQFVSDVATVRRTGRTAAFPNVLVVGDVAPPKGIPFSRVKVLSGRSYRPSVPAEAVVDWIAADRLGLRLGDRVDVILNPAVLYDLGGRSSPPTPVKAPVRIVGIVVFPTSVPAVGQAALSGIAVTPAFMRTYAQYLPPSNDAPTVLLRSEAAIPSFLERVRSLPRSVDVVSTLPEHVAGVKRTLRFEVLALWALSALVGTAAVAIFGQTIARTTRVESEDFAPLRSLGMSRAALTSIGIGRAVAIGAVATVVAGVVAVLTSALTPIGISRVVEPSPGITVDVVVLVIGLATTLLIVPALAWLPSLRVARSRTEGIARPSAIAAAAAGAPVAMAIGVRMALDPGRGSRAVPVRAAVLGSLVGIGALAGALVFAGGLAHLIRTPELYGFNWSMIVIDEGDPEGFQAALTGDPDVESLSRGGSINMRVNRKQLIPFVYEPGAIRPTILAGRAPDGTGEIALGPSLMREMNLRIGDSVPAEMDREDGPPDRGRLRIVGTTVVPAVLFQQVLPGEGAAISVTSIQQLFPGAIHADEQIPAIVRFRPGVDINAKHGALKARFPSMFTIQMRQPAGDLISLIRVERIPIALAAVLAFMAAATMGHALLSSIRRRRHDLAVLKTLGFQSGQIRRAVGWQAAVLATIALIPGLPLGIAAGRWAWTAFATNIGVLAVPRIPLLAVLLIVPGTLLLAILVARAPAGNAARTQPALVLRTE